MGGRPENGKNTLEPNNTKDSVGFTNSHVFTNSLFLGNGYSACELCCSRGFTESLISPSSSLKVAPQLGGNANSNTSSSNQLWMPSFWTIFLDFLWFLVMQPFWFPDSHCNLGLQLVYFAHCTHLVFSWWWCSLSEFLMKMFYLDDIDHTWNWTGSYSLFVSKWLSAM